MKSRLLKTVGFLSITLVLLATGCQPSKTTDTTDDFSLETFVKVNSMESVMEKYKSARVESTFYQPPLDDGEWTSFQETNIYVKDDDGIAAYTIWSNGSESAVFKDNAYFKYADGTYGVYGFIDDESLEQFYTSWIAGLIYIPLKEEKLISNTVKNDVRTLVIQSEMDEPHTFYYGITQGIIENTYELDLESNLILRASECVLDGDKRQVLAEGRVLYGEDDSLSEPEYVLSCRDMSETRTVYLVRDTGTSEEKTVTFTLSKKANFMLEPESDYEMFTDPAYTIPYEGSPAGEYPDETTLYIRKS